ncbi:aspartyl protease [Sphingomonas metalli]|uniref:Aspartyl protease n=1 Tax=Sphingomonas metalli TaxID=1779358 RepID=A0A916WRZ5_9SPHN|nr:TIGR02281 family clan AA aspartic protease [Sphingomonas metalli]GGB24307.1 aspartyl protease [Sphingomonas metalli]
MISSLTMKSLPVAIAALGITGMTHPGAGTSFARPAASQAVPGAEARIALPHGRLTLKRASDGLFYVTAHVNDAPVRFVVDTGANVVVLTKADARAAGIDAPAQTARVALRTAGGRRAMRWASIRNLKIGGHSVPNTDAVVTAGDGPPHSLLGQSALSRFESVTLRGDQLELRI